MSSYLPLIIVGVVALIVVGVWLGYRAEKKRSEELRALADSLEWSFSPGKREGAGPLERFDLFDRGHSRVSLNTMRGELATDGLACSAQAGDYRYRETHGSGKDRRTSTYNFSYLAFRLPFESTPDLLIRAEGMFDKLKGAMGFDDIDFESEQFSRKFYVKSRDRRFAFDLIHPRMMAMLLDTDPPRIELVDGYVCLTDGSSRWSSQQFQRQIEFAREFLGLWPEHLAADLHS